MTDIDAPAQGDATGRFGRWLEDACLALAWNAGQTVRFWREEPLEVDLIVEGSWGEWAIEVKTGRFGTHDLAGMLEFVRRHPRFRPLVICGHGTEIAARSAGVTTIPWRDYLLGGPLCT